VLRLQKGPSDWDTTLAAPWCRRLDRASHNGLDEAVTAACDAGDVAGAAHAIAQGFAQIADVSANNTLHHSRVPPDGRHEIGLADDLACLPHERDQYVQGAATKFDGRAIPLESSRRRKKPEGSKGVELIPVPFEALFRLDGHVLV
jgi:hypothetical protein